MGGWRGVLNKFFWERVWVVDFVMWEKVHKLMVLQFTNLQISGASIIPKRKKSDYSD